MRAGLLRLSYGIFVSTFTQDKLKDGQAVMLPINETAVMKAKLAEWISESVVIMNERKRVKVEHCWRKTGLLDIWDVEKRSFLMTTAVSEISRLFPNSQHVDQSGVSNEIDDIEHFDDFSCPVVTEVDEEKGEVKNKEGEEEAEVEAELIAEVTVHAQRIGVASVSEVGERGG